MLDRCVNPVSSHEIVCKDHNRWAGGFLLTKPPLGYDLALTALSWGPERTLAAYLGAAVIRYQHHCPDCQFISRDDRDTTRHYCRYSRVHYRQQADARRFPQHLDIHLRRTSIAQQMEKEAFPDIYLHEFCNRCIY